MTLLREIEALRLLRLRCRQAGGINAFARLHGLSQAYISLAVSGNRTIGPKILKAIGLKRIVSYEHVEKP